MERSSWCEGVRPRSARLAAAIATASSLLFVVPAHADTAVAGNVVDATTGAGITGVKLQVQNNGTDLGSCYSSGAGAFACVLKSVSGRGVQTVTLLASHKDFEGASKVLSIVDGKADLPSYSIALLPSGLSKCSSSGVDHLVLVGQFAKSTRSEAEAKHLSDRMTAALSYNMLVMLQKRRIESSLQPRFLSCVEAQPRSPNLAGLYAKALQADALVYGRISPASNTSALVDVTTFIASEGDSAGLPPFTANKGVDLESPEAARLDEKTHGTVLAAVAASYERQNRPRECVEVSNMVRALLGDLPSAVRAVRDRCKKATGMAGLLPGNK